MWAVASSRWRNEVSSAVRRSPAMWPVETSARGKRRDVRARALRGPRALCEAAYNSRWTRNEAGGSPLTSLCIPSKEVPMRHITSLRPSPAMVVAFIALMLALAGGAYAQLRIPRNSVGTKQLRANSVTSPKVKAGSLHLSDFRAGQLPQGPAGPAGPAGAQGPAGPTGATGERGPAGATNLTVRTFNGNGQSEATCLPGERATGGGGTITGNGTGALVNSEPIEIDGRVRSWLVNSSVDTDPITAWVVCAAP